MNLILIMGGAVALGTVIGLGLVFIGLSFCGDNTVDF